MTPKDWVMLISNIGVGAVVAFILLWKVVGALAKILERLAVMTEIMSIMSKQFDKTVQRLLDMLVDKRGRA